MIYLPLSDRLCSKPRLKIMVGILFVITNTQKSQKKRRWSHPKPHHVSQNQPQMPMLDRAAQFTPFAALMGYEAAVVETARLTSERRELSSQEAEELNRRLTTLIAHLPDRPEATIEYFVPDDRKAGGAYVSVTRRVRHISVPERTLVMEDGMVIPLDDVVSLIGELF